MSKVAATLYDALSVVPLVAARTRLVVLAELLDEGDGDGLGEGLGIPEGAADAAGDDDGEGDDDGDGLVDATGAVLTS